MLNELCQLSYALKTTGVVPEEWHPQMKLLPKVSAKAPCFRISIDPNGNIAVIDTVDEELAVTLRKWEPSNGDSFPGFNIKSLYRLILNETEKKELKAWRDGKKPVDMEVLKGWCLEEARNGDNKTLAKNSLNKIPNTLSAKVGDIPDRFSCLKNLFERLNSYKVEEKEDGDQQGGQSFQAALEKYLWNVMAAGDNSRCLFPLLICEGNEKKNPKEDRGLNNSIFLDVSDWSEYPVAGRECMEWLNQRLVVDSKMKLDSTASDSSVSIDAFGNDIGGGNDKLPKVKLPVIADVSLRAMNSESSCQYRYRTIDAVSFPIGQESRKQAKGALEWLGDESREGETWGKVDKDELIFAYPSILPTVSLKLASCFGAKKADDTEDRFANAAQNVIRSLHGISKDLNALELRVFALKKMDKARTKVVFYRNYYAQRLVDAARDWEIGCENIPSIIFRTWGEEKGKIDEVEPQVPFPLQIARCLNRVWKQDGTTECETPVIPHAQGIELLLDEQPIRFVPHLLSVLLRNSQGLFLSLGNATNKGEIITFKQYNDVHKKLAPSILGLLLFKLGIRKEKYMSNAPFLIGRMLKLADELHALYCKEVRDDKMPPQLIGNTLMTAALDAPTQALAQLALRLKPYYGWARTHQGNSGPLAGYFIGLYGDVASQLAELELPVRFNDAERAQVLLGYLSANPKKEKNNNNASDLNTKEEQQ
jgi:hypothetical protein